MVIEQILEEVIAPTRWLLYGKPDSGKTYMAGTFPRPLFLDLENGLASLRPLLHEGVALKRIAVGRTYNEYLSAVELAAEALFAKGDPGFDTLIVDSLNQLQFLMVQSILTDFDKSRQYDDQLTRDDYGKLGRMMDVHIAHLFSLPCQVVLLCGTQKESDGQIWPSLLGNKSLVSIVRLVDAMGYCFAELIDQRPTYNVSFSTCDEWLAKIRGIDLEFVLPNVYPLERE